MLGKPTPRVRGDRRIGENSRTAKTKKDNERKLNHEKSKYDINGHPAGVGVFCVFTRSASGLSQELRQKLQHLFRRWSAKPKYRGFQYRSWRGSAVAQHHWNTEHSCWNGRAGFQR